MHHWIELIELYLVLDWNIFIMSLGESQVLLLRFLLEKMSFAFFMDIVRGIKNLIAPLDRAHRVVLGT